MKLEWSPAERLEGHWAQPGLVADSGGPCVVTFTVQPDGDYVLSWAVVVEHRRRTAAEAQRFAARIAELINTLPVVEP